MIDMLAYPVVLEAKLKNERGLGSKKMQQDSDSRSSELNRHGIEK